MPRDECLYFVKPPAPPAEPRCGRRWRAVLARYRKTNHLDAADPNATICPPPADLKGAVRRYAMASGHP